MSLIGLGPTSASGPAQGATPPKASLSLVAAVESDQRSPTVLNLEEIRVRIDVTAKELRAATDLNGQLQRDLVQASAATSELREETSLVAQRTLKNAIDGYRHSEVPRGLLAADDLTASLRATALGDAAISSDTESFDAYRTLRKDLEIEESELVSKEVRALQATAEMQELETRLAEELAVFGELEERRVTTRRPWCRSRPRTGLGPAVASRASTSTPAPSTGPTRSSTPGASPAPGAAATRASTWLANTGVELVAPVSGRVEHFSNSVGGRSYRLFGDDGNYFYGTHLSGFAKQGRVNAGEVIGYVGDDGNAAGIPHLHFEIHLGGAATRSTPSSTWPPSAPAPSTSRAAGGRPLRVSPGGETSSAVALAWAMDRLGAGGRPQTLTVTDLVTCWPWWERTLTLTE